jgi:hypothetical protein
MNYLTNQGRLLPATADFAKKTQAPRIALACLIWMRASSFLGTHPKHTLTKVMSMAESSTNIFAQLAARQSHLQLKDFQAAES